MRPGSQFVCVSPAARECGRYAPTAQPYSVHSIEKRSGFRAASVVLVVGAAAWLATGCATTSIRGRLTDCRDSTPLAGADVQLATDAPNMGWDAIKTAADGSYEFKFGDATQLMPVTLTASKNGFGTIQKRYSAVPPAGDICMQPTQR
jgi:hypothetical protein